MTIVKVKNKNYVSSLDEVEKAVTKIAKNIDAAIAKEKQAYCGTANEVLGLTVPQQRQLLKAGYSFSTLLPDDQLIIWDAVWRHSKYHESKAQALLWLSNIKDTSTLIEFWPTINKWVEHIDSWDASDNLSSVYVRILEDAEPVIYPTLQKWNNSSNPWERRQSIVSLLYFSSARRKVLPHNKILALIEKLIDDPDKFVQKGVGWSLRECYSVHPAGTEKFIRRHATAISAIAFTAAAEKWPKSFLTEIKAMRSKQRKKSRSKKF
jgi:3-methyladenine DNA glycosylase AlkD